MRLFILYFFLMLLCVGLTVFFFPHIEKVIDASKYKESHPKTSEYRFFVEPSQDFICPPAAEQPVESEYSIHASFKEQAEQIFTYGGTLFSVAIYGLRSAFSDTTTFLLDDI